MNEPFAILRARLRRPRKRGCIVVCPRAKAGSAPRGPRGLGRRPRRRGRGLQCASTRNFRPSEGNRKRGCCEQEGAQGDLDGRASKEKKGASAAKVQFAEELPQKRKDRLDREVWTALSSLEKVRWPSNQQHVSLEKKILRAER